MITKNKPEPIQDILARVIEDLKRKSEQTEENSNDE